MLNASAVFLERIDSASRDFQSLIELQFQDLPTPSVLATSVLDAAHSADRIVNGIYSRTEFATSGSIAKSPQQGWKSATLSDVNGALSPAPVLTLTYPSDIQTDRLWLVGTLSSFPVDFTVEIQTGGTWQQILSVLGNTKRVWNVINNTTWTLSAIRITITKISTANHSAVLLQAGTIGTLILTGNDMADYDIVEEISNESRNPLGQVTSNEFSMTLDNQHGWLSPTNEDSPLYGFMRPGVVIKPHIGIKVNATTYEMVPLGVFYALNWAAPTASIQASVIGRDRLMKALDVQLPPILALMDTTVAATFERLFSSLGITNYFIDATLTTNIDIAWISNGKAIDNVISLAEVGLANVWVDRYDAIRVTSVMTNGVSVATLTEDNQLIDFDNPQDFLSIYPAVRISYNVPRLDAIGSIVKLDKVQLAVGTNVFNDIEFSTPVGHLAYIRLVPDGVAEVTSIEHGANKCSLTINSTVATNIDIEIYGNFIVSDAGAVEFVDTELAQFWPDKVLRVDNPFIQTVDAATAYSQSIITFCKDPLAYYTTEVLGNPLLELQDMVTIQSGTSINSTTNLLASIVRSRIRFDGGLSCTMLLRKPWM